MAVEQQVLIPDLVNEMAEEILRKVPYQPSHRTVSHSWACFFSSDVYELTRVSGVTAKLNQEKKTFSICIQYLRLDANDDSFHEIIRGLFKRKVFLLPLENDNRITFEFWKSGGRDPIVPYYEERNNPLRVTLEKKELTAKDYYSCNYYIDLNRVEFERFINYLESIPSRMLPESFLQALQELLNKAPKGQALEKENDPLVGIVPFTTWRFN